MEKSKKQKKNDSINHCNWDREPMENEQQMLILQKYQLDLLIVKRQTEITAYKSTNIRNERGM